MISKKFPGEKKSRKRELSFPCFLVYFKGNQAIL